MKKVSKKNKHLSSKRIKNKQKLLFFTSFMLTAISSQTIETYALNYTNWSEWSASAPSNTYGRVVETQTQYMYRDKEFTNQPTSTLAGWSQTGYKYDDVSNWKSISIIEHDACSIGATVDTGHVSGNTGTIANARRTYELSGYWYWDKQSDAGWNMFASPNGTHETHCGKKFRYKYEANNGKGVVTYAHVNQTRTVTPMWEFWRWKNNGEWTYQLTQPPAQAHREITSRTLYRYRDLIDTTAPTINITGNPNTWTKDSVTLTITASDAEAGVRSITLPNGQVVSGGSATYTVGENKDYTFYATDNLGNTSSQTISVTKIDKTYPTYTRVEMKNVTTDGYDIYIYGVSDGQSGVKEVRFPTWTEANGQDDLAPNWNTNPSVKGKNLGNGTYKFRVNRSDHNNEFGNYITHIYMYDNVGNYHAIAVNYNLQDIDKPTMTITGNPDTWTTQSATLTITTSDYGTGVKNITLPNGQVVRDTSTTYTVHTNGEYKFKVTDNAGNETTEIVNVTKIDRTAPTISVTGVPKDWVNHDVELTVTVKDDVSGVKEIILQDGTIIDAGGKKSHTFTYTTKTGGRQFITAIDNAGNKFDTGFSNIIVLIDKESPTLWVRPNTTQWTNQNIILSISGRENPIGSSSGFKEIILPDNTVVPGAVATYEVTKNGSYTVKMTDNAGNTTTEIKKISNIDKVKPSIKVTGNPDNWTDKNVTLTITGSDSESGVKEIILPNNEVVDRSSTTYTVNANGDYKFKVVDLAGNEITQTVKVSKIDKSKPSIKITGNPDKWTNQDVTLTINASDTGSGVKEIQLPNNQVVTGDSATYTVSANGEYRFRVTDNVGNVTTETVNVTKIDKTNPTATITGAPNGWINKDVTLTINASDSESGIKQIELPDGTIVNNSKATYVATEYGIYTFKVTDNAGNVFTLKSPTIFMDKDKPGVWTLGNPDKWTNQDVILTVKTNDGIARASGVKSIILPDKTVVNKDSATYTVSANGDYTFKAIDNAGNENTHIAKVTKIDKTKPTLTITGNPTEWTTKNVTLTIKGADTGSGVKQIQLPNNQVVTGNSTTYTVTANGDYKFKVVDLAGNETTETVSVTKIDKDGPVINYTLTPNNWTNGNVTINLDVTDTGIGLKEIHMPNGTVVSTSTASYTVSKNGAYYFKAVDKVGNETILPILVTNIDVKAPSLNINNNQNWTNQNVQINITGAD